MQVFPATTVLRFGDCFRRLSAYRRKKLFHMSARKFDNYQEAIFALNSLQSNSAYIQKALLKRNAEPDVNVINTAKHLNSLGIKMKDLNDLNIIHVSGTKGKGSTCALTESILRQHGLKTGFYSSPHLISVNERIRINGQPLDKEMFIKYFWHVYEILQMNVKKQEEMPQYFMFLTVMAYYVFIKEKVDVAIIEVGIGGTYDCTNIIQKPVVVGVTRLDMDHMVLLGNTIHLIAEQKAGIFKPGVPAFSVPQPSGALAVLQSKAESLGCSLNVVPPFETFRRQQGDLLMFNTAEMVQSLNASLAIALSYMWLKEKLPDTPFVNDAEIFNGKNPSPVITIPCELPPEFFKGIQSCVWPGRFHIIKKGNFSFYLDGAHTQHSMRCCMRWFEELSQQEARELGGQPSLRILLFNSTKNRKAETLLDSVAESYFDMALFAPNRLCEDKDAADDQSNFNVDPQEEMKQCETNRNVWCHLTSNLSENVKAEVFNDGSASNRNFPITDRYSNPQNTKLFTCLTDAAKWLNLFNDHSDYDGNDLQALTNSTQTHHVQILVTGSLHLVGGFLSIVEPHVAGC